MLLRDTMDRQRTRQMDSIRDTYRMDLESHTRTVYDGLGDGRNLVTLCKMDGHVLRQPLGMGLLQVPVTYKILW